MGHKVNPKIFRIQTIYTWSSKWFSFKKKYRDNLREDILIKEELYEKLKKAGIDKVEIERFGDEIRVLAYVAKPGLIIGRKGEGIEEIKKQIQKKILKDEKKNLKINILEVREFSLSANIIAQSIVSDLEKRIPFRRTMKQTILRVKKAGSKGIKLVLSGRLNGAEIARAEKLTDGKLPLHTLRADIDYAQETARTTYGAIGVKVWIYKGEIFNNQTIKNE
ncbi:30S ribosomal protein S3 [Candidatus Kuenenbacteria bacterium HGW-Kuenenbacteria-1]|uniref:Small ribosomal subunit protein uS3 n=1 Tax=Candidatus Kuenenbacteria bacterium HGW-Kuenenbacteria-1 TaxID=2013812 RepID=A0A2N1UNF2_9BACT|nr:MAG: 30S ribosomal protein S3 [Candidatus Kuenenbacteria bacterium HGW-Kuenenbacteria-1]